MRTVIDMHDAKRFPDPRKHGTSEPFWWGLAGFLSLAALAVPNFIGMSPDPGVRLLVVESALFFTGAFVGCLRPHRVWRWALAAFIAIALRDILLTFGPTTQIDMLRFVNHLSSNIGVYLLETIPVFVGAIFGAWTTRAGLD